MKNLISVRLVNLIACSFILALLVTSCTKEEVVLVEQEPVEVIIRGCTDLDSENFNPSANADDGSCVYARDKFIGTFTKTVSCNNVVIPGQVTTLVISEDPSRLDGIIMKFTTRGGLPTINTTYKAIVSGRDLEIPEQTTSLRSTVKGDGSLDLQKTLVLTTESRFLQTVTDCTQEYQKTD